MALASATAAGVRMTIRRRRADLCHAQPRITRRLPRCACYILIGGIIGLVAAGVTRALYSIEDGFDGCRSIGCGGRRSADWSSAIVGWLAPDTLGVGYYNIRGISRISNLAVARSLGSVVMKFISWSISLGQRHVGRNAGAVGDVGGWQSVPCSAPQLAWLLPQAGIDVRIAALVGMAAMFAGASRAMLASVVFAFETTLQPLGLLPLVGRLRGVVSGFVAA